MEEKGAFPSRGTWLGREAPLCSHQMHGGWCEGPEPGGAPNAEPALPQGFCALRGDGGKWGQGRRTESSRGEA